MKAIKTASGLLAVFAVLGFVSEAGTQTIRHDYRITVGQQMLGFADGRYNIGHGSSFDSGNRPWSMVYIGPLGNYDVPFTATQGLIGFCCILTTLIVLPVVLTVRWKKKRAAP